MRRKGFGETLEGGPRREDFDNGRERTKRRARRVRVTIADDYEAASETTGDGTGDRDAERSPVVAKNPTARLKRRAKKVRVTIAEPRARRRAMARAIETPKGAPSRQKPHHGI